MRRILILALGLTITACAQPVPSNEAGFGLPTLPPEAPVDGTREEISGTLRVESNGCFTLEVGPGERPWIVWPPGAQQDGGEVVIDGSVVVGDGDRLVGDGTLATADVLPEWENPDSFFSSFGQFCEAQERGVVVFAQVGPEPTA